MCPAVSDDRVARECAQATAERRSGLQIADVRPRELILIVMANHLFEEERLDPRGLERLQRSKLAVLCEQAVRSSAFYRDRLAGLSFDPANDLLSMLPFTTREDLEKDQEAFPPYGSLLTQPVEAYQRLHQTSAAGAARWSGWTPPRLGPGGCAVGQ